MRRVSSLCVVYRGTGGPIRCARQLVEFLTIPQTQCLLGHSDMLRHIDRKARLVERWQHHSCLFDVSSSSYHDRHTREKCEIFFKYIFTFWHTEWHIWTRQPVFPIVLKANQLLFPWQLAEESMVQGAWIDDWWTIWAHKFWALATYLLSMSWILSHNIKKKRQRAMNPAVLWIHCSEGKTGYESLATLSQLQS